jgi:hypothetical protein
MNPGFGQGMQFHFGKDSRVREWRHDAASQWNCNQGGSLIRLFYFRSWLYFRSRRLVLARQATGHWRCGFAAALTLQQAYQDERSA